LKLHYRATTEKIKVALVVVSVYITKLNSLTDLRTLY